MSIEEVTGADGTEEKRGIPPHLEYGLEESEEAEGPALEEEYEETVSMEEGNPKEETEEQKSEEEEPVEEPSEGGAHIAPKLKCAHNALHRLYGIPPYFYLMLGKCK